MRTISHRNELGAMVLSMGERRKSWDKEAQRGKNRTRKKERHTTIPSLLAE
jgi:hypothetical protein